MNKVLTRPVILAVLAIVACMALVPAAQAQENQFEAMVGNYWPSDIKVPVLVGNQEQTLRIGYKSDLIYGLRYGRRINEKFGLGVRWSHFNFAAARNDSISTDCSRCTFTGDFFDFSGEFYPGGGNFAVFAGIGWVTGQFEIRVPGVGNNPKASDDAFTSHLGAAYTFKIGEKFYLRPEYLFRWMSLDHSPTGAIYDDNDSQATLGVGWTF